MRTDEDRDCLWDWILKMMDQRRQKIKLIRVSLLIRVQPPAIYDLNPDKESGRWFQNAARMTLGTLKKIMAHIK